MIDLKQAKKNDPVQRNVDKGLENVESSPMDPPSAYDDNHVKNTPYEQHHQVIRKLMDEHTNAMKQIEDFEKALLQFKTNGYLLDPVINQVFSDFFKYFDDNIIVHNVKEEKVLFPLLTKRLIESGEHSTGPVPKTAIDVMEDDHVKFIQLGTLTFNLLGLATRLIDNRSRTFVFDTAYENGRELIEMLKLHIYREDYTLFPLAHKLITQEEYDSMWKELQKF